MKLSLVVPCYNEEENVNVFYDNIKQNYNKDLDYELIFIDDGSKDETLEKLKELAKLDKKHVKTISFSRNFGKEAAILAGLKEAKGDYVGIIDADMQQDPKIMLEMLDILEKDNYYDSVAAYQKERKENKVISFFKRNFYEIMNSTSSFEIKQGASDFRLFRRAVVDSILLLEEDNRFSKGIFSWVGFHTYYLPYVPHKREHGSTKFNFVKLLTYGVGGIVSFSIKPLKASIIIGMIFSVLFLISFIAFVITTNVIIGLCALILFISTIQFLIMGVICEYLSQIHIQSKNRPIYIIKEKINIK